MSEHLSQSQLTGYSGRTLDPHELLAVDGHLASCDVCHERLTGTLPGVAKLSLSTAIQPGEGPFHLDYEQHLEPYADGHANDIDREIVDSHVAECAQCADELRDLLAFKQQPGVAIAGTGPVKSSRLKKWLPQWPFFANPALATAVVIAVVILGVAVLLWTTYRASRRVEQARTNQSESEQQRAVEKEQPQPAPTVHTADNPQTNKSPDLPAPSHEEPLIALNDAGGRFLVNQRGQLEGVNLPPDLKESVERALATRRLGDSPALTGWSTGAASLRSELERQNTFAPLAPMDVVIETDRPKFRWQALDGARHYVVTIHDARFREVMSSGPISGTEWTAPNSLERGVTYSWQISALKDAQTIVSPQPPLPEARFRILDARALATLAQLKVSTKNSHLVIGVFYWKHGLIEESERELQALAQANPNSTVVADLLASLRSSRGR